MVKVLEIKASSNPEKKLDVVLLNDTGRKKTVRIGDRSMSDYTHHRDEERKKSYIARHQAREDWTLAGATTAGYWSRWLLWNLTTLEASKQDVFRRFPSLKK